jgi:Derlin-2/3
LAPLSLLSHAPGMSFLLPPMTRHVDDLQHVLVRTVQKGLSPLFNLPFLSSPLAYVPIYFWSRRHPSTPISLFGLVTITAPYLPFALVAFSWLLTGTWRAAASDLVGCAVGHVGWFIRDVWTREMVGGPTIFSEAPEPL